MGAEKTIGKLVLVAIGLVGLGYGFGSMLIPLLGYLGFAGTMAQGVGMFGGFVLALVYAGMGWVALKLD